MELPKPVCMLHKVTNTCQSKYDPMCMVYQLLDCKYDKLSQNLQTAKVIDVVADTGLLAESVAVTV